MEKRSDLKLLTAGLAVAVLCGYVSIFIQFFPNRADALGHDYATFIPALQDGFIWYHVNGIFSIPWFTPSFFGGSLGYANPQSGFFMIPQMLTWFFDPLTVVQITMILFAGVGFLGFFILLRRVFGLGEPAALVGATLFLFNGFYAHRMAIGHFGAHPFMLVPWILLVLLHPLPETKPERFIAYVTDCALVGLFFAYMVQSWFLVLMIPAIAAVVGVALLKEIGGGSLRTFWIRLGCGGVAGLMLSAAKLSATLYLMANFGRSSYALPGAKSFAAAAGLLLRSMFISPAFDPNRLDAMTNLQWMLERHEWEFSLTPVPLVILMAGCLFFGAGHPIRRWSIYLRNLCWTRVAAFALVMALPICLNTYDDGWNHLLKQLPVIKNASSLVRWFIIPMPAIVVAASWTLDRSQAFARWQVAAAALAVSAVVIFNVAADRSFYHRQDYKPWRIVSDYHRVRSGDRVPAIREIVAYFDARGRLAAAPISQGPNDMMVDGRSPLLCYDPLFGYRLETFPIKTLHPGPVMAEKDGVLNLKNPACFVWPKANQCLPGDHFTAGQVSRAEAFVHYRPFEFEMPIFQKAANVTNAVAIFLAFGVLTIKGIRALHRLLPTRGNPW